MSPLATLRERLGPNATRVLVVAAVLLVFFLVLLIVARTQGGTYEVKATFDDVRGLIPGGEVRAGAVNVGTVSAVELGENDEPEVTMKVEDDFRLHEGAIANIRLGSNIGAVNRTVELTQGDTTKPELPEGTTLSGEETDQPVNFDQAVETLSPGTRANIKRFLIGLDEALKGRGKDFDRTLRHSSDAVNETADLLAQVNRDGEALRTLVHDGERVVSALATSPQDVGEAAERTATLLQTTANRQAELAESVELLGPALKGGRETLDSLANATPELRELVRGLNPLADRLGPFARVLPGATEAAGPFLVQTRRLVEEGPDDLRRFGPIIEAADPVAKKLYPAIQGALPLGQELRAFSPEIIGAFQNFGAATGAFDATGHLINVASGNAQTLPASTASTEIGPADCTPGLLEEPFIRLPGTNECLPWENYEDSFIELPGGAG